jgi:hypothetical protein
MRARVQRTLIRWSRIYLLTSLLSTDFRSCLVPSIPGILMCFILVWSWKGGMCLIFRG